MNITDVDDKIILRARQNHLFEQYKQDNGSNTDKIKKDIETSFSYSINKRETAVNDAENEYKFAEERHKKDMKENLMGQQVKLQNVTNDFRKYNNAKDQSDGNNELLCIMRDIFCANIIINSK
eukprot:365082_1